MNVESIHHIHILTVTEMINCLSGQLMVIFEVQYNDGDSKNSYPDCKENYLYSKLKSPSLYLNL